MTVPASVEATTPDTDSHGGGPGAAPAPEVPGAGGSEPSVGERWRSVPRRWRITLAVLAAVAGVDAVVAVAGGFGSTGTQGASGTSSSFDASPAGTEAMADLLSRFGHRVSRLQEPFSTTAIPLSTTLVVADPVSWDTGQTHALTVFVRSGGRVVLAGGPFNSSVLRTLLGTQNVPLLSPVGVASAHAVGNAPEVNGVSIVDADPSDGAWDQVGRTTSILRNGGASLAVAANAGAGRGRAPGVGLAAAQRVAGLSRQRSLRPRPRRWPGARRGVRRIRARVRPRGAGCASVALEVGSARGRAGGGGVDVVGRPSVRAARAGPACLSPGPRGVRRRPGHGARRHRCPTRRRGRGARTPRRVVRAVPLRRSPGRLLRRTGCGRGAVSPGCPTLSCTRRWWPRRTGRARWQRDAAYAWLELERRSHP